VVVVTATDGSGISIESNPFTVTNVDEPEWGHVVSYTVKPGDALSRLASRFDTSVPEILEDNPRVISPNQIYVGERLFIPVGGRM
jgi:LysM repeat protein